MNKRLFLLLLLLTFLLAFSSCSENHAGGETVNEKVSLFMPDGLTPASFASIQFFEIGDTSKLPVYETLTDEKGQYFVNVVTESAGYFNVIAELDDSLYTMQDTVLISKDSHLVRDDTLKLPGSISGVVALQPNHAHLLDNVYVMALGAGRAVNVSSTGRFTLGKLPQGKYDLQVDTDINDYGPRFLNVSIQPGVADTIEDTIHLPYSGIPVITGLAATYDTLQGTVTLCWDSSSYGDIANYLIYRKSSDSLDWDDKPIGWVSPEKNSFIDPLFWDKKDGTPFWGEEDFDYSVVIRDNATKEGSKYKYATVKVVSPFEVTTFIYSNYYNEEMESKDTLTTRDSIVAVMSAKNNKRTYNKVSWALNHKDSLIKSTQLSSNQVTLSDTVKFQIKKEGEHTIFVIVEDVIGTVWYDTLKVPVWGFPEKPELRIDSIFGYVADVSWTKSTCSDFKKYQLLVLNNSETFLDTTILDQNVTNLTLPHLLPSNAYSIVIAVEDTLGLLTRSDTVIAKTKTLWSKGINSLELRDSLCSEVVDNKIYLLGGGSQSLEVFDPTENCWAKLQNAPRAFNQCATTAIGDSIYVMGGYYYNDEFKTETLSNEFYLYDIHNDNWEKLADMPTERAHLSAEVVGDKIYLLGGMVYGDKVYNFSDLIEVYDITTKIWDTASSLSIPKHSFATEVVDEKIYILGGVAYQENSDVVRTVEVYNSITNSVGIVSTIPFKSSYYKSCIDGDKMYIMGSFQNFYEYSPDLGIWKELVDTPFQREGITIEHINNNIYVMGGKKGNKELDLVDVYQISK